MIITKTTNFPVHKIISIKKLIEFLNTTIEKYNIPLTYQIKLLDPCFEIVFKYNESEEGDCPSKTCVFNLQDDFVVIFRENYIPNFYCDFTATYTMDSDYDHEVQKFKAVQWDGSEESAHRVIAFVKNNNFKINYAAARKNLLTGELISLEINELLIRKNGFVTNMDSRLPVLNADDRDFNNPFITWVFEDE